MWRKILDLGLHAGRVVMCTPISGPDIEICQICLLLPEEEIFFYSESVSCRRDISELMISSSGRPMKLLGYEVERCEGWLYTCVMDFRHIDSEVTSVDVVKP